MKTEKRDVFVADDGKVFDNPDACQEYERKIAANMQRIDGLKVYKVVSGFDTTEGRGYHRTTYIITDASFSVVLDFCFDRYGRPLSGWYGDTFYEQWIIHPLEGMTAAEAVARSHEHHTGIGLSAGEAEALFLSATPIDHPDFPKPVFPWPRKAKVKIL